MVESLVEMLQGPTQGQVYAAQALGHLASDPTSLNRMMAAGASEVCPSGSAHVFCCCLATSLCQYFWT